MKEQLILEVLSEPTKWVLTNKKGDTFTFSPNTSNGEELSDFLMGCKAITSVKSEPMNYESQKAIQDNLVESYPFKKSESAEEVLLLQKALNEYINLRHTQQECTGFIDGYKKAMHDFVNNSKAMKDGEIRFGNHLKAYFKIVDNKIEILDAVNGWGDNVPKEEIKVEYLTNKEK